MKREATAEADFRAFSRVPRMAERVHVVTWDDPKPSAGAALRMGGLPFLRAFLEGKLPAPPMARLLGFDLVATEDGMAAFEVAPSCT